MPHPWDGPDGDDDLARQRRKREARLLDEQLVDAPETTLADVVADVLAASDGEPASLDVRNYLASNGHHWRTIEAVIGYLHRQEAPELQSAPGASSPGASSPAAPSPSVQPSTRWLP